MNLFLLNFFLINTMLQEDSQIETKELKKDSGILASSTNEFISLQKNLFDSNENANNFNQSTNSQPVPNFQKEFNSENKNNNSQVVG